MLYFVMLYYLYYKHILILLLCKLKNAKIFKNLLYGICNEQKLLFHCSRLELMSESPDSCALSLSSAARHIDFHS